MKKMAEMDKSSRIWIYQTDRMLTENEQMSLAQKCAEFIDSWTSHGAKMDASIDFLHGRFLVLATDEQRAAASGCGIDKSVGFVKNLGEILGVDFFKRTLVFYMENDVMHEVELHQFWAMKKAGLISDSTIVFDNTIKKVGELEANWMVPFSSSWHAEMWLR